MVGPGRGIPRGSGTGGSSFAKTRPWPMIWIHNRPIKMGTAGMQEVLMGDPGDSNHRESRGKANQTGDPPRGPRAEPIQYPEGDWDPDPREDRNRSHRQFRARTDSERRVPIGFLNQDSRGPTGSPPPCGRCLWRRTASACPEATRRQPGPEAEFPDRTNRPD